MATASTRSEIEARVLKEIEALLRELKGAGAAGSVRPNASLERELGLGSLERVELLSRLERRFRLRAPERTLGEAETPQALAEAFVTAGEAEAVSPAEGETPVFEPSRLAPPRDASTLVEVLLHRAHAEPDAPHLFLTGDAAREETVSYGALYAEALTVASGLTESGLVPEERVAIMLPTGREFFQAFMGVLLAGGVPVPLYPPLGASGMEEYARRQASIVDDSKACLFVTFDRARPVAAILHSRVDSLMEVVTVSELVDRARSFEPKRYDGEAPALIQYTSGSTGEPKGAGLTHRNLLSNIQAIGAALAIGPSDVGVSWLPLYHDMGLIGAWLTPLFFGFPMAIFSPLAFLERPERWLWTLHRRRGTISPAPNFAYELCVRKIRSEDLEGLDLASWRVALNGAEPVSPDTLERFARRFERYGFRRNGFLPVYGLAESSLLLTAPEIGRPVRVENVARDPFEKQGIVESPGRDHTPALRFVSVGRAVPGHQVMVVDDKARPLPERREGRLWFRGPSAMKGYFGNPEATAAVSRGDGWLDSGDRAFVAEGEVFITGRAKDIIIRAGRNLNPQEMERVVGEIEGVRPGSIAAFGVRDPGAGTEKVVLVAECREDDPASRSRIESAIFARVVETIGAPPDDVVLVALRTVPKTSSGKIRRSLCRERYLAGELGKRQKPSYRLMIGLGYRAFISKARRWLVLAYRGLYGIYFGCLAAGFGAGAWLAARVSPSRRLRQRTVRWLSRVFLTLSGVRLLVQGRERLEGEEGPFVLVANHASYLDPLPLMASLSLDYAFVVKHEAFDWPFVGGFLRKLEHLPVDRLDAPRSASSARAMHALIAGGRSLIVFPEGTFSYATGLRPFKLGAFKLAAEAGRPLVPIALVGTRRWLRDGSLIPRPGPVGVVIGEPCRVGDSFAEVVRSREATAELIAARVGEPRLDLVSAAPSA